MVVVEDGAVEAAGITTRTSMVMAAEEIEDTVGRTVEVASIIITMLGTIEITAMETIRVQAVAEEEEVMVETTTRLVMEALAMAVGTMEEVLEVALAAAVEVVGAVALLQAPKLLLEGNPCTVISTTLRLAGGLTSI